MGAVVCSLIDLGGGGIEGEGEGIEGMGESKKGMGIEEGVEATRLECLRQAKWFCGNEIVP